MNEGVMGKLGSLQIYIDTNGDGVIYNTNTNTQLVRFCSLKHAAEFTQMIVNLCLRMGENSIEELESLTELTAMVKESIGEVKEELESARSRFASTAQEA